AVEQVAEEVAEVAEVVGGEREPARARASAAETRAHGTEGADLVVLLALGLVADHVVRGRDLLEPLLRGGITLVRVRVKRARQLAVRALDLLRRRRLGDAEHGVVVLLEPLALRGHARPYPRTLTIAGRRTLPFQR